MFALADVMSLTLHHHENFTLEHLGIANKNFRDSMFYHFKIVSLEIICLAEPITIYYDLLHFSLAGTRCASVGIQYERLLF